MVQYKNIKPILDLVLVKEIEEKSKSSILIPETVKNKPTKGKVIAFGNGKITEDGIIPQEIKIGDIIIFTRNLPLEILDDNNEKCLMIHQENILAKVVK